MKDNTKLQVVIIIYWDDACNVLSTIINTTLNKVLLFKNVTLFIATLGSL